MKNEKYSKFLGLIPEVGNIKKIKNVDAAGPLGDLGLTAHVLIPQYLR